MVPLIFRRHYGNLLKSLIVTASRWPILFRGPTRETVLGITIKKKEEDLEEKMKVNKPGRSKLG